MASIMERRLAPPVIDDWPFSDMTTGGRAGHVGGDGRDLRRGLKKSATRRD
jgi:hypothetical protein